MKGEKTQVYLIGAFYEMIELLENTNFEIIGLIDKQQKKDIFERYSLLGNDDWLLHRGPLPNKEKVVVSPDSPNVRSDLISRYFSCGFHSPSVIGGHISKDCLVGNGSVVQQQAFVSSQCKVGVGVKINVAAKIMHNCQIDDFATIAPAAVLLGGVSIGRQAYIGANATILPGLKIGNSAIVGAGAVVTHDVEDFKTVKGVPAR